MSARAAHHPVPSATVGIRTGVKASIPSSRRRPHRADLSGCRASNPGAPSVRQPQGCRMLRFALILTIAAGTARAAAKEAGILFVQSPAGGATPAGMESADSILAMCYVLGMRILSADIRDIAGSLQNMTEGFRCATDPVIAYDGTRIAFAGQRGEGQPLQIWEMRLNTGALYSITPSDADCVSPVYMPDGRVVFASLLSREYEEQGGLRSWSLHECIPGRSAPSRLTFNPSSDFDPAVLPDGRIVYSSWQHVGNRFWPRGTTALMLINSDGTGIFPLTGNHRAPWLKRGAVPLGADRIAFIQSPTNREFGAGIPVTVSLDDPFGPHTALLPSNDYEATGLVRLPDGRILLSARPLENPDATFGLYVLQEGRLQLLYDDPDFHELSPVSGAASPPPEHRISTVVPETPFGYLLLLNCYESDRFGGDLLPPGAVHRIRVIEGLPFAPETAAGIRFASVPGRSHKPLVNPYSATGYIPSRILGEVAPASDGSAYLKVPADRPLRLQLIDHDGFAIANERAWFWVRPNERRACIGCHENRELAPANAVPIAGRRAPTDLTEADAWQTVSFRSDIQPILSTTCAVSGCHTSPEPMAGMNLSDDWGAGSLDAGPVGQSSAAYVNLLKPQKGKPLSVGGRRVHPGDARHSPLLWMLYGRALGAQYAPAPFERPLMSPHPGPMLPEARLDLFRKWVDLGAPFDDGTAVNLHAYRSAAAVPRRAKP